MTTAVKIENTGTHDVKVNVWETSSPADEGKVVDSFDLKPGESTPSITIYSWRKGVTVLEMGVA